MEEIDDNLHLGFLRREDLVKLKAGEPIEMSLSLFVLITFGDQDVYSWERLEKAVWAFSSNLLVEVVSWNKDDIGTIKLHEYV